MKRVKATQLTSLKSQRVFEFDDFRSAFKHLVEMERLTSSLRGLAKRSGLSVGILSMMIQGKQPLSERSFLNLMNSFQLNAREKSYLTALRNYELGETQEVKRDALSRLARFKEFRDRHARALDSSSYLSSWLMVALRELASVDGFSLDPHWIQKHLAFSTELSAITKALAFLTEHEFIQVDSNGRVKVSENSIDAEGKFFLMSMNAYHRQMLELAKQSLQTQTSQDRHIQGVTLTLHRAQLEEVRQILNEAQRKIIALSESSLDSNQVYQIEFVALPLTTLIPPSKTKENPLP